MQLSFSSLLAIATVLATASAETLRFQHWNLRYDSKRDGQSISDTIASLDSALPDESSINWYGDYTEETWSKRRIGIANDVIFNRAEIFTVNEALKNQVDDLKTLLVQLGDGDSWDYVGIGRDDGKESGEYEAIFYKTNKISLQSDYTYWLSNTPFEPSKYPGAGSYRTATVGHFKVRSSNKPFTVITTHLDDQSDDQRKLGASLLRYNGAYEYVNSEGPVFLTGDFNSQYEGSYSGGYQIATGAAESVAINSTFSDKYASSISSTFTWDDLWVETAVERRSGHYATFPGFKAFGDVSALSTGKIDFQFGGSPNSNARNIQQKGFKVLRHKISEIFYDNEWHLSDHRPLITDIEF